MIGLDTGHLVYNYGTKLQAYAMQSLLESNGERCEIIQWHIKDLGFFNDIYDSYRIIKQVKECFGFRFQYWFKAIYRYRAIDSFNKKYHIHKYYCTFDQMKEKVKIYSSVFCGSDQAWLPGNISNHYYTLEFCGDTVFKAAYAPSFGLDYIPDEYKEQYKSFLSRLDSISIREISGKSIIYSLINVDVPVVLDPTLLLEKNDWDQLKKESKLKDIKDKYIFCYFLGNNAQHREEVKKFSGENNLKIVNLQHFNSYTDADNYFGNYNLYNVTPQDFIKLISNAEYVFTDSFHCTVFSIQYHKQFTIFHRFSKIDTKSTNTRISSLLAQLGLENRLFSDSQNLDNSIIDYSIVDEKLKTLRYKSSMYLNEALEKKRNV